MKSVHRVTTGPIRVSLLGVTDERVVKFLLPSVHVYVGVGQLAEIDLRARDGETGYCALDGHVAQY